MNFPTNSNYLILGERKTGKTELAQHILKKCISNGGKLHNPIILDMSNKEKFEIIDDKLKEISNQTYTFLLDNYSTKDNKDKNITTLLSRSPSFGTHSIVVSGYALGVSPLNNLYMDYILVPKIEDTYTLKLIYKNYASKVFDTLDIYKTINKNLYRGTFLILRPKSRSFNLYNPTPSLWERFLSSCGIN